MSAAPSNLLSLLRLLDDTLPADDAARVRDRLSDDAEFADQYALMLRAMRPAAHVDALLDHADDVDPCDVAEFVEGRMTEERRASFEAECWSSEGVLREVIATWNAAREAAMLEYQAESNGRGLVPRPGDCWRRSHRRSPCLERGPCLRPSMSNGQGGATCCRRVRRDKRAGRPW